ncbi:MAG: DegQ family serine endoprotease [Bryobacteraceae bacterium]
MKKSSLILLVLVAALTGAMLTWQFAKEPEGPQYVSAQSQKFLSLTFAPVVKASTPAVVNVSSTRTISRARGGENIPPGMEDLFRDFFGFGRGMPEQEMPPRRSSGIGSGVIVTADGYILTNNHVVAEADEVKVSLSDRREFTAKVVGTDPLTDVAVLKIDAQKLPVLPISDSTKVQVGDVALAIGNPFGIGQTVTMGIIGATGRSGLNPENYEDFIQTDAAINPGNSGGALINTNGELIGINTAIISSGAGGNQGIGFAIPVNMAKGVMDQLVKTGKVTRGYLGVFIQDLTPELVRAFKLKDRNGAVVTRVDPGSPADKAGVEVGDVAKAVGGEEVQDVNEFRLLISRTQPGTTVPLTVNRQGKEVELSVTLDERDSNVAGAEPDVPGGGAGGDAMSGVAVEELTAEVARQLRLPADTEGVVVSRVDPQSAAALAGLRRGDIIQQVNQKPVTTVSEFQQTVRQSGTEPVLLLVSRGGGTIFLVVEPKQQE